MRPGGQGSEDRRQQLERRADVRKARVLGPTGIPGVFRVRLIGAQSESLARGSSSYKIGALVPVGSEQGDGLQTILLGGIVSNSGQASASTSIPPRRGIFGEQAIVEYCDPALIFAGETVTVSLFGRRFNPSHTAVVVVWQNDPIPSWTPDERVTIGDQQFIDSTRIDFVLTVPSDFPVPPEGARLIVTVE